MRRCMTPNSHSKSSMLNLNKLVGDCFQDKQNNKQINYDNFIFVDSLTNHKIAIGEAKNKYGQKSKRNTVHPTSSKFQRKVQSGRLNSKQNKQMEQINDCWNFMKTTKLFQMDKLKSKLFNKQQENSDGKQINAYEKVHKQKKDLRQFIQKYIYALSLEQFRKSIEQNKQNKTQFKTKNINKKVMNLSKHIPSKINKQNIENIIQQILQSEDIVQDKLILGSLVDEFDEFPEQKRLKQLLLHHCCIKNKQFQHLVQPKRQPLNKFLTSRKNKRQHFEYKNEMKQLKFLQLDENSILKKYNKDNLKKEECSGNQKDSQACYKFKKIQVAVENGLIYDLLFWLVRWPNLLYAIDCRGNNFLHIAAKNNQIQVYDILLKKMGIEHLSHKNKSGKTPVQLAKLFSSFDVIHRNKQYQPFL